jgi:hypothetical protein
MPTMTALYRRMIGQRSNFNLDCPYLFHGLKQRIRCELLP